jgi:hypothetical protein
LGRGWRTCAQDARPELLQLKQLASRAAELLNVSRSAVQRAAKVELPQKIAEVPGAAGVTA